MVLFRIGIVMLLVMMIFLIVTLRCFRAFNADPNNRLGKAPSAAKMSSLAIISALMFSFGVAFICTGMMQMRSM